LKVFARSAPTVSAASLGAFRLLFGAIAAASALRTLALGWIEPQYTEPTYRFPYDGLEWLGVGPPGLVYARYFGIVLAGLSLAVGYRARMSAALLGLLFAWNHLVDKALYLNHHHLVCLFALLLSFAPSDRAFVWRSEGSRPEISRSWLWLFRAQVALVYIHAGLGKLHEDWLLRAQPLRLWLGERDHWPWIGAWLAEPKTAWLASWFGLVFDLFIPVFLLWSRTRRVAMAAALFFHLATALLFPIGVFPWLMMAAATLLLAPDWPERVPWLRPRRPRAAAESAPRPWSRLGRSAATIFLAWQILWPLRIHLVPGDPLWHECGFRFSWRVMLMEKQGRASFIVREGGALGEPRQERVEPSSRLTPIQGRMMATQADMILRFARDLAAEYEARGWREVEVRVESSVTLNGDPAAPLIDPELDLARIDPAPWDRDWILPRPPRTLEASRNSEDDE
jgi:uncharacterized membrane protein YphA (DoxX/SURF4 family)